MQEMNDDALDGVDINLGDLDITGTDEIGFDEVDDFINENLQDELVQEALERGVDLRQYARQVERDLRATESSSIYDYLQESQNIATLHSQIQACDQVLQTMEQMLGGFQTDLGNISCEIQSLQEKSLSMNVKLKNRKEVSITLSAVVNELVVPADMVMSICEMDVNEVYLTYLIALSRKIAFANRPEVREMAAYADVAQELEMLSTKASEKSRVFLLTKINSLRKAKSNIQLCQQNTLIKFKGLYSFLKDNNKAVADEVLKEYIETMSKVYFSYFKEYNTSLEKLLLTDDVPDKSDLLGAEDGVKKSMFSSRISIKNRSAFFTLGDRLQVLDGLEAPVLVPHVAALQSQKLSYDAIFRSANYLLLDNACSEYLFIGDFFGTRGQTTLDFFYSLFGKTLANCLKAVETSISNSYDCVGLFMCIRLNHDFRLLMSRRLVHSMRIPCLDRYFERLVQYLWPRFKLVLDLNINSIQSCTPKAVGTVDVHPHFVTRRYAEFSVALVTLNDGFNSELLVSSLEQLRVQVENLLLRFASEFLNRKEQLIFLINNYDLVISILKEHSSVKLETPELVSFQSLLASRTHEFVEEQLGPLIGDMIEFVKVTEPLVAAAQAPDGGGAASINVDVPLVEGLVRKFAQDWRRIIDNLNTHVLQSFDNFRNGMTILQAVLTQLILYYQRFQNVLAVPPFKALPIRNELINIHHVMVEVKKHRNTF